MSDTNILVVDLNDVLVVQEQETDILELPNGELMVIQESDVQLLTVAEQGPPGITTVVHVSEDDVAYTKRTDFVGNTIYKGEAEPGSSESASVWRIRRLVIASDDDVTELWANGSAEFVHAWADRLSLAYA